jgi:hypothetical protein
MDRVPNFTVDLGKKCAECGNSGAVDSGICLACTLKAIQGRTMISAIGKAVQTRFMSLRRG